MTVDDGHHSSWEYSRIEVRQGLMFHDKVHLQHAIRRWAFSKKRQFMDAISYIRCPILTLQMKHNNK
jgi:hypothetical protein